MTYKKTVCLIVLILISLNVASLDAARKGHKSFGKRLCAFFMGAVVATSRVNGLVQCDLREQFGIRELTLCANAEQHHVDAALQACGGLCLNDYQGIGSTPLESAVQLKNAAVVKALLQRGAKTGAAFHDAINYHSDPTEFIKILVESGADINSNDDRVDEGNTPLHWAVMYGNVELVRLLLRLGADPLKLNANNQLPSSMVTYLYRRPNSIEISRLLAVAEEEYRNKEYYANHLSATLHNYQDSDDL